MSTTKNTTKTELGGGNFAGWTNSQEFFIGGPFGVNGAITLSKAQALRLTTVMSERLDVAVLDPGASLGDKTDALVQLLQQQARVAKEKFSKVHGEWVDLNAELHKERNAARVTLAREEIRFNATSKSLTAAEEKIKLLMAQIESDAAQLEIERLKAELQKAREQIEVLTPLVITDIDVMEEPVW